MSAVILIVDDDPQIRRVLRSSLTKQDCTCLEARNGEEALEKIARSNPDLILLDYNMPHMNGLETCRAIRASWDTPIIMLTVRDSEADIVAALDAGADDYISKPYRTPELMARLRANLRRPLTGPAPAPHRLKIGTVEVDFDAREVLASGRKVRLSPKEFDLLWYLVTHANRTVPHRELLQAVWGMEYGGEVEYLRVAINQLRKKIEHDTANPAHLLTEPRIGYRLHLGE